METDDSKNEKHLQRMKIGSNLQLIRKWQTENGGFRRSPPRSVSESLYAWIEECKRSCINNRLSASLKQELYSLGIITNGMVHQEDYDRAMWAICALRRIGAEDGNGPKGDGLKEDESIAAWISDMKNLARIDPGSLLLRDLRGMIPRVYEMEFAPLIKEQSPTYERRSRENMGMETYEFVIENGRLPDILSEDVLERKLANWVISIENGLDLMSLEDAGKGMKHEGASKKLMLEIASRPPKEKDAQWRWWSSVAMEMMRNPSDGSRWQDRVYRISPISHAKKLGLNIEKVRAGKRGWEGGAWGVDVMCVSMACGKAMGSKGNSTQVPMYGTEDAASKKEALTLNN